MDIYDKADFDGQKKAKTQLEKIFSGQTLTFDQHFEDKGGVDIFMTATTENGNQYTYAIECKDRKYTHTYSNDWFIEVHKYNKLMEWSKKGYRPCYLNTFKDDYIAIWNLDKVTPEWKEKTLGKSTVEDRGKTYRTVGQLSLDKSTFQHNFI